MTTRAKPRHPESIEQRLFVQRWRLHPMLSQWPACAVPNGGRRNVREAALMKAEGVSRGVPDWLCFMPGMMPFRTACVGLALEFKAPGNAPRVTPEQQGWHAHLRECGWRVEIVQSAEEAWWVIDDTYDPDLRKPLGPRPTRQP